MIEKKYKKTYLVYTLIWFYFIIQKNMSQAIKKKLQKLIFAFEASQLTRTLDLTLRAIDIDIRIDVIWYYLIAFIWQNIFKLLQPPKFYLQSLFKNFKKLSKSPVFATFFNCCSIYNIIYSYPQEIQNPTQKLFYN